MVVNLLERGRGVSAVSCGGEGSAWHGVRGLDIGVRRTGSFLRQEAVSATALLFLTLSLSLLDRGVGKWLLPTDFGRGIRERVECAGLARTGLPHQAD